ncbi:MAG: UbiA-like protein EboC [Balneolaceae bacterium]
MFTSKLRALLELIRPANIVTAFADILAGYAAAGGVILVTGSPFSASPAGLGWLLISTFGLYGGGVVFNDVFDAELDAKERPERAIPSGRISRAGAGILGTVLLSGGITAAFWVSGISGILASGIAVCALYYDAQAKHSAFWGPVFMGLCRGGNLILGVSILPAMILQTGFIAIFPLFYIGSITLISQGEVHGGSKGYGLTALGGVTLVIAGLALLALYPSYQLFTALPFILLFSGIVLPPFARAARNPTPSFIRKAVKRGVLSLILLNSALAAGFAGFPAGGLTLVLLPISFLFARIFSVT